MFAWGMSVGSVSIVGWAGIVSVIDGTVQAVSTMKPTRIIEVKFVFMVCYSLSFA
jgi:hypothetical protein